MLLASVLSKQMMKLQENFNESLPGRSISYFAGALNRLSHSIAAIGPRRRSQVSSARSIAAILEVDDATVSPATRSVYCDRPRSHVRIARRPSRFVAVREWVPCARYRRWRSAYGSVVRRRNAPVVVARGCRDPEWHLTLAAVRWNGGHIIEGTRKRATCRTASSRGAATSRTAATASRTTSTPSRATWIRRRRCSRASCSTRRTATSRPMTTKFRPSQQVRISRLARVRPVSPIRPSSLSRPDVLCVLSGHEEWILTFRGISALNFSHCLHIIRFVCYVPYYVYAVLSAAAVDMAQLRDLKSASVFHLSLSFFLSLSPSFQRLTSARNICRNDSRCNEEIRARDLARCSLI